MTGVPPVVAAVTRSVVDATGAGAGWLLAAVDSGFEVVAVAGDAGPRATVGRTLPHGPGAAAFVAGSGQPLAMRPAADGGDAGTGDLDDVAALLGRRPTALLAVPCAVDDRTVGVLELVDKVGGGPFTFDDVEVATILAGIAAVALTDGTPAGPSVPSPAQLGQALAHLAATDPPRYARLAPALGALLLG
jgi:GAF domain-containing protein